jgi:hypothetical protein
VWQIRRFDGDVKLWNDVLSDATLTHRKGPGLKFALRTMEDFESFMRAVHVVAGHGLAALAQFDPEALAGADDEEFDAIALFGKEGRVKLRIRTHKTRERDSSITGAKKQAIWDSHLNSNAKCAISILPCDTGNMALCLLSAITVHP